MISSQLSIFIIHLTLRISCTKSRNIYFDLPQICVGFLCQPEFFGYVSFSFLFEPVDLSWSKILRKPVDKSATDKIAKVAFINVLFLWVHIVLLR